MNKIHLLARGLPVADIASQLEAAPELWNVHRDRTAPPHSPHFELDDIWARWAAPDVDGSREHDAVWYPDVFEKIPAVVAATYDIMRAYCGDRLGGVLLTRIPAGKSCKPHVDEGWHAGYYQKFALQIAAVPGQEFCFDGESLETLPGDLFWFDNSQRHWVNNPTQDDRITLIICVNTTWRL